MPPATMELPPRNPVFSITMTDAPSSDALTAAASPAPPPPTMMTSAERVTSSAGAFSSSLLKTPSVSPACLRQSCTAAISTRLDTVAPVMVSTAVVWLSTIAAEIFPNTGSVTPGVSTWSTTSTEVMALSVTVTSTVMGPCMAVMVEV